MGGSGQSGNPNAAGGQLGQMANPQTKDPMQNLNRQGAPNFKGPVRQATAQQPWSFNQNYDPSKPTGEGNWRRLPNQPAQQADRLAPPPMGPIPAGGGQKPGSQYGGYGSPEMQFFQNYMQQKYPSPVSNMGGAPNAVAIEQERNRQAMAGDPMVQFMQQFARNGRMTEPRGGQPGQPAGGGK